jgi:hypothetical protein
VLPGLIPTASDISVAIPRHLADDDATQLLALGWTEPWDPTRWRVVDAMPATDTEVLAHAITWADHIRELGGEGVITGDEMRALEASARQAGLIQTSLEAAAGAAHLTRRLHPQARSFARLIRGVT